MDFFVLWISQNPQDLIHLNQTRLQVLLLHYTDRRLDLTKKSFLLISRTDYFLNGSQARPVINVFADTMVPTSLSSFT